MKVNKTLRVFFLIAALVVFLYFENNAISLTSIPVQSNRIPVNFDGYKIVHLSDLHSKSFGKNQKSLIKEIKKINPDLVVFTGDLVDSRHYNPEAGVSLLSQITGIAPVYYVTGNHEWSWRSFNALEEALKTSGVKVLRNTNDMIKKGRDEIYIVGIDDPSASYNGLSDAKKTEVKINDAITGIKEDQFSILLAHRPELFSLYNQYGFDLVFAGHAHGGQVRLPFVGGIVAPNQGFFPRYSAGKYSNNNSNMIVSRGLGNSIIPQRLFNRPEVVIVTLQRQ